MTILTGIMAAIFAMFVGFIALLVSALFICGTVLLVNGIFKFIIEAKDAYWNE